MLGLTKKRLDCNWFLFDLLVKQFYFCHIFSGIDEDVNSLGQFSTELIVEAVARCLHVIDSSIEVSYKLPPSMAARFRIGTNLANAVQVWRLHLQIKVALSSH